MKPILFNAKMVRAILDGRKTQTRRVNKDGAEFSVPDMSFFDPESRTYAIRNYADREHQQRISLVQAPVPICPGDILWVRETWQRTKAGRYIYRADKEIRGGSAYYNEHCRLDDGWRPSIHMPREAARLFLRVMDVRVERLQDITIDDAIAEGCNEIIPITEFRLIWSKTIKPANRDRYGWHANPWVWVISFERYDPADPEEGGSGNV